MDQSFHRARTREAGHARRCLDMHGIEGCAAALDVKANSINSTVGAEERRPGPSSPWTNMGTVPFCGSEPGGSGDSAGSRG
jgi:hypothetical protein